MDRTIFREYDVRGIVGRGLDEAAVTAIGRALATRLVEEGRRTAAVGRDVRHSSSPFATALVAALAAGGIDVVDLGVVPTPLLYWSIVREGLDGGVMITGSHNPVSYNGLKICVGPSAIWGEEIQDLRRRAEAGRFSSGRGTVRSLDPVPRYVDELLGRFSFSRSFDVVVDCGNGVAGPLVPAILRRAGHRVTELYCEPDGSFPNHLPDPEVPEYVRDLVARVRADGADVGFGFDGDGDRVGVIDERGRKISADWLVAVYAEDLLERHPGGVVRYDVKCGDFLDAFVRRAGGKPVMGRTGHSILKQDVKDLDAVLGGELSGHIVFGREYLPIDDPFFCALRLLELMERRELRCSELFAAIPPSFATAEIKVPAPDEGKFAIVEALQRSLGARYDVIAIDGVRVRIGDGWGLVRASNTTANLTVRLEAASEAGLREVRRVFLEELGVHPELDLGPLHGAF